jgi:hypothetical protein
MSYFKNRVVCLWLGCWLFVLLAGCSAGESKFLAGNLNGVNHTSAGINYFTVNGYGGPNISPYGYGGGMCCAMLPRQWQPGLKLEVEWEVDPDPYARLKRKTSGYGPDEDAYAKHKANYRKYRAIVDLPPYEEELCALEIHFLPCNQIKISTSCWRYPSPNSPIKEPIKMKESAVCLK